jgi:hypothetical protein
MAAKRDISIYKGDTYIHQLTVKDSSNTVIDVSARTYSGSIRQTNLSDPVATFSIDMGDSANGNVVFSIASSITSNIKNGIYQFDFQEVVGTRTTTLIYGKAEVYGGDITRG